MTPWLEEYEFNFREVKTNMNKCSIYNMYRAVGPDVGSGKAMCAIYSLT